MYDFIVPADGTLIEAFAAAAKRADKTQRYRIFIKKGNYVLEGNFTFSSKVRMMLPLADTLSALSAGTVSTSTGALPSSTILAVPVM